MTLGIFLRLEFAKPASFGGYIASFLEALIEFGTVSAAAQAMEADPRLMWGLVRFINKGFGEIVIVERGCRGGAYVTPEGMKLVRQFRKIEGGIREVFANDLRYIERIIGDDPTRPKPALRWERWRQSHVASIEKTKPATKLKKIKTRIAAYRPSVWVYLALYPGHKGRLGRFWFGAENAIILQAVAKYGSVSAVAASMAWTYYRVKREIKQMNKYLGETVVTKRGRGGGACITPMGEKLVERYFKIEGEIYLIFAKELRQIAKLVGDDPKAAQIIPRYAQLREPKRAKPRVKSQPPLSTSPPKPADPHARSAGRARTVARRSNS